MLKCGCLQPSRSAFAQRPGPSLAGPGPRRGAIWAPTASRRSVSYVATDQDDPQEVVELDSSAPPARYAVVGGTGPRREVLLLIDDPTDAGSLAMELRHRGFPASACRTVTRRSHGDTVGRPGE